MAKVYLETSFISYLVARPSRDLIMAAHQQTTRDWWERELPKHDAYISEAVLEEAQRGDPTGAASRLSVMADLPVLVVSDEAEELARRLISKHALPQKAFLDAIHIAVASVYGMNYLLTWNCKHIANLTMRSAIEKTCRETGYDPPAIGTPEEFEES